MNARRCICWIDIQPVKGAASPMRYPSMPETSNGGALGWERGLVWVMNGLQTEQPPERHALSAVVQRAPNAIPVRDHERGVDDVKCICATIERFEALEEPYHVPQRR